MLSNAGKMDSRIKQETPVAAANNEQQGIKVNKSMKWGGGGVIISPVVSISCYLKLIG